MKDTRFKYGVLPWDKFKFSLLMFILENILNPKKELSDVREIGDYVKVTPTKFDKVFIIQLLELSVETAFRIIADGNGERLSPVLKDF